MAGLLRLINHHSTFELVVLWGGDPDDEVGPEAEGPAEQGQEEDDADHDGVDVEIIGDATTDTSDTAVGSAAS